MVVNMYIAVILENFSQATADVQTGLTQDDFDIYYEKWENYDPKATGYISLKKAYNFLNELDPPLKLPRPNKIQLATLQVPLYTDDNINCAELLAALTRHVLGTEGVGDSSIMPKQTEKKSKVEYKVIGDTMLRQRQMHSGRIILKNWRRFHRRKNENPGNFLFQLGASLIKLGE